MCYVFMITIKRNILLVTISAILGLSLFISCKKRSVDGTLIITLAPETSNDINFISGESWRYVPQSRIAAFNPEKSSSFKILTEKFYSACYPEISYDGKYMLFAAQENEGDIWQIWEMKLNNRRSRKVISLRDDCIDPAYLPGGKLIFSKMTTNDTVKTVHCLYTANLDGSGIQQVTFSPVTNFATTVIRDGRVLTISTQLFPIQKDPMLMVMRPDGTKADMFYIGREGSHFSARTRETTDGKLVFIEAGSAGDVVSISYNRPLHTKVNHTSEIDGDFKAVIPVRSGKYLVSFRKTASDRFAIYEFDPENNILGQDIYNDPANNVLDVVIARKYNRPKKLPSEVDMHVKTGLLLCQDINVIGSHSDSDNPGHIRASMIEVIGVDSSLGVVPVEQDGSFQLKVLADMPFRIRSLDSNGNELNGTCSWLWMRPNERRGCVGCHEDPELVPVNRIPLAVKSDPVIIPTSINKIKEKEVELE
jgi:hypothetical protein